MNPSVWAMNTFLVCAGIGFVIGAIAHLLKVD